MADSNYGIGWLDGVGPSISQIDLASGTTKAITCESMNNPVDVKMVDNRMFILDSGTYDEKGNQLRAGVYELVNDEVVKIADATEMAVCGSKIFCFYAPFTEGHAIPTYKVYDTKTNTLADFCDGTDIDYPCKISVHPTKRHVYITSYRMADSGYPDYNAPGYCVIYDETGTKLGQFDCGVCPGYAVPTSL